MDYLYGVLAVGIAIILMCLLQLVKKTLREYLKNGRNKGNSRN